MEFKNLDEHELKYNLNEAINNCLDFEGIKINGVELAQDLDHDYYELLNKFEDHLKLIIKYT